MNSSAAAIVAVACVITAQSPLFGQSGYTFTKIADTTTAAPGGAGNFTSFGDPSIDKGEVAFRGFYQEGGSRGGIYSTTGGLHVVADWKFKMPGSTADFNSFSDPIMRDGNVAFRGTDFFSSHRGIYTEVGGTLNKIVDSTTAVPGGTGTFADLSAFAFDGANTAFFGANATFSPTQRGVYSDIGGTLGAIADMNTPVPNGAGNFTNARSPAFDGGDVAFFGVHGASQAGIYTASNGSIELVLANGTPLPNGAGPIGIQHFATDGSGYVIRSIDSNGNFNGIYTYSNSLAVVADLNTAIPDGTGSFNNFYKPSIDGGNVAFLGEGSGGQHGIYTNLTGILAKVIDNGDLLDGKSISRIGLTSATAAGPIEISGGQLAFTVLFTDGSRGVYVASYLPTETEIIAGNASAAGSLLGGTSQLGGIEFAFNGATDGEFAVEYSINHDSSFLSPGIVLDGSSFQMWDLAFIPSVPVGGDSFDSVLLTLNYNPGLINGNLQVYHQFDGQATLLSLGTLGNLGVNQYAIAGDGLLQLRIGHFSEIILTGGGSDAPQGSAPSVPEPSSVVILGVLAGLLGGRHQRRRNFATA